MSGQARLQTAMQAVLHTLYPPHCLTCNAIVGTEGGLCGDCWVDTSFITGLACDLCGVPLPGEDPGEPVHCDECLRIPRPWSRGRAVMAYRGNGRRLVLALKHGDRTDLADSVSEWLAEAGRGLLEQETVIVPVPLHWRRLFTRRYNQSALLAQGLARASGLTCVPDLLQRTRYTQTQGGRTAEGRFRNIMGSIRINPTRQQQVDGAGILLVDDVMTSGATFTACAEACLAERAADIRVLALARVAKDD